MDAVARWLTERGVEPADARSYVGAIFHGLAVSAQAHPAEGFRDLITEHSTAGGLNEQAYRELVAAGWTERIQEVLTLIHERVLGRATLETKLPINR
jgi:pyrroline-5-carboxylate reductase